MQHLMYLQNKAGDLVDVAVEKLEVGLIMWKQVQNLGPTRTETTIAQSEVDSFIAEQEWD